MRKSFSNGFYLDEDKADFTAPNGVTYAWDGDKWVVKAFKADENDFVTKVDFEEDQERQDTDFAADQDRQDAEIDTSRIQARHLGGAAVQGGLHLQS